MLKKLLNLSNRFLYLRSQDIPKVHLRCLVKFGQNCYLTVVLFFHKNCFLRATAMTLYTLLSIVPVIALAYGIAKGFGLEKILQSWLENQFSGQEEILSWMMKFSGAILGRAKGSVIAGVGVLFLFWSMYRLLWQIEQAFNAIWEIQKPRNLQQRLNDYIFILVVCPFLLILSSSLTIFIVSNLSDLLTRNTSLKVILPLLKMLPGCVIWILLYFMYVFLPNTKVNHLPALFGGILFGTAYSLWQWFYLNSQIALSGYNAVYGSFAALPIFILWLNISWMIVLLGAQFVFVSQNNTTGAAINLWPTTQINHTQKMIYILHIVALCACRFHESKPALTCPEIAKIIALHPYRTLQLLHSLQKNQILAACEGLQTTWQPALPPEQLTTALVVQRLEGDENSLPQFFADSQLKTLYLQRNNTDDQNIPLHKIGIHFPEK